MEANHCQAQMQKPLNHLLMTIPFFPPLQLYPPTLRRFLQPRGVQRAARSTGAAACRHGRLSAGRTGAADATPGGQTQQEQPGEGAQVAQTARCGWPRPLVESL